MKILSPVLKTATRLFVPYSDNLKVRALHAKFDPATRFWYAPASVDLTPFTPWLSPPTRTYLSVPFKENERAKELGCNFDSNTRQWFIESNQPQSAQVLATWGPKPRIYLHVSFEDNHYVKSLGAIFDSQAKQWFVKEWNPLFEPFKQPLVWEPLRVPFEDNEKVKSLGAVFNSHSKTWAFDPRRHSQEKFAFWMSSPNSKNPTVILDSTSPPPPQSPSLLSKVDKVYLEVPFSDQAKARELGAKFCEEKKKFFVKDPFPSLSPFTKWLNKKKFVLKTSTEPFLGNVGETQSLRRSTM